jgi:hypothetical protein
MALVKNTLINAIKNVFEPQLGADITKEQKETIATIANKLATAIDDYIKSGTVTVASGIPVSTAGSATAQTGATTAPGTGSIS